MPIKKNSTTVTKADLQKKVDELEKMLKEESVVPNSESDSPVPSDDEIHTLLKENRRLAEELDKAKQTDKFVAIECISKGRVWLPDPASRNGEPSDRNKGRLLKKYGELTLIPLHWMTDFVANQLTPFLRGELRVNNERARKLNPHITIVDIELPESFTRNAVTEDEVIAIAKGGSDGFHEFVSKYEKYPYVLARAQGIIDDQSSKVKDKSNYKIMLDGFSDHLDEVLHPKKEEAEDK